MKTRLFLLSLFALACTSCLISCKSDGPKRRERVPPSVTDSTLPWNRPPKWEGNSKYGQMMPGSR